jgi:hypothetical protein
MTHETRDHSFRADSHSARNTAFSHQPIKTHFEAESRGRKISKSHVVRERLEHVPRQRRRTASLTAMPTLSYRISGWPTDRPSCAEEGIFARYGLWPETSSLMLDLL